jgi:O-acetyl-ADP-ribose deacetylase (regulator of RNase III)
MRVTVAAGAIEVVRGDITDQSTDVIVNAANNHLWMGGGVAGAIRRRGGPDVEKAAIDLGPINVGESVITGAGELLAKHVIHAAVMGQDLHTNETMIRNATLSSLRLAESKGFHSISYPALGTGVGGFSMFHCAKIMITESVGFLLEAKHLNLIRFVLFDARSAGIFEAELRLQFSTKRH